jgi:branched-chain amino acid transport system ATP-binding protein
MLEVRSLSASYGRVEVLHGVGLTVRDGEIVSLIGPNTAGKSTLLRGISRIGDARYRGEIRFDGQQLLEREGHQIAGLGIAHVIEGRHIFPKLSVAENLRLGAWTRRPGQPGEIADSVDRVVALFPPVGKRLSQAAGTLSGGEQQMVAIGRALMMKPKLLLLDEPSHGLAPKVVDELHAAMEQIHDEGVAILLVEQNAQLALSVSSRAYVLAAGEIALEGESAALLRDDEVRCTYLGI